MKDLIWGFSSWPLKVNFPCFLVFYCFSANCTILTLLCEWKIQTKICYTSWHLYIRIYIHYSPNIPSGLFSDQLHQASITLTYMSIFTYVAYCRRVLISTTIVILLYYLSLCLLSLFPWEETGAPGQNTRQRVKCACSNDLSHLSFLFS
jgi:hypothetical protein